MSKFLVTLDKDVSPSYLNGAFAGSSGVNHAALVAIGDVTTEGSGNGQFLSFHGYGQIDCYQGYLYVSDPGNRRIQRFSMPSGTYDSQVAISSMFGLGYRGESLVIDKANGQIHVASSDQFVDNTWVGYWNLSDWPSLTTGNRQGGYGSNSASSVAGKVHSGNGLIFIDGNALGVSGTGQRRMIIWKRSDGSLIADSGSTVGAMIRPCYDGTKLFGGGVQTTGTFPGLHSFNTATLASLNRVDNAQLGFVNRKGVISNASVSLYHTDSIEHSGRCYLREYLTGRLLAWNMNTEAFIDSFLSAGHNEASRILGGLSGPFSIVNTALAGKMGIWNAHSSAYSDYILLWSGNSDNDNNQSFLMGVPVDTSEVSWVYTILKNNTTLERILCSGKNLASEKIAFEYKKNSGSFHRCTLAEAGLPSHFISEGDNTFSAGDTLTVKALMSSWDRLDEDADMVATRDKLSIEELIVTLQFDVLDSHPVLDIAINQEVPSASLTMDVVI